MNFFFINFDHLFFPSQCHLMCIYLSSCSLVYQNNMECLHCLADLDIDKDRWSNHYRKGLHGQRILHLDSNLKWKKSWTLTKKFGWFLSSCLSKVVTILLKLYIVPFWHFLNDTAIISQPSLLHSHLPELQRIL